MEYQLIPLVGDANYLFRSIANTLLGTRENHRYLLYLNEND